MGNHRFGRSWEGVRRRGTACAAHDARRLRSLLAARIVGSTAVFLAVLLPTAVFAQTADVPVDPVLNPGDVVQLIVWRDAEMSGEFEIMPDSTLGHPLLRQVKVGGVPVSVAEERLRVFLGRFEANPRIVLLPRFRVLVVGNGVGSPGFHTFSPNVSIAEAVFIAGPTEHAKLDRVRLVRAGREQIIDLTQLSSPEGRMLIRSGDQILIEARRNIRRDVILPVVTFLGSVTAILKFVSRF